MAVISMKKQYAGHAKRVMLGTWSFLRQFMYTKFIIVTHHALTMSKMNRLYGVSMPEKGISQLVAVDLQKAESMVA